MKTLLAAAKLAGVKGIVLVEHDMDLVASYSSRIVALPAAACWQIFRPNNSLPTRT